MSTSSPSRVWFITGTSQGFGLELVRVALHRGDTVVATSRRPDDVAATFPEAAASGKLLAVPLDLRDEKQIAQTVDAAAAKFGRLDVLVNNAGYGLYAAVEEATDDEIKALYEVNVFGLLRVTRAVLPHMRKQRSGHVVNLSSMGGLVGFTGAGIYCSTKFAVEGLSATLAMEVAPLGIRVTVVEPGPFRTDFLGDSIAKTEKAIADYAETAGKARAAVAARHGHQPGDPAAAAEAIVQAVLAEKPPLHLVLGKFAYDHAVKHLADMGAELEAWRETTLGCDFKE